MRLFKKYGLDCLFVVSNCLGRSAYNMVERRMVPLSNQLAGEIKKCYVTYDSSIFLGFILPHDYYGSHLDDNGNTINEELELCNFKRAGTPIKLKTLHHIEMVAILFSISDEYLADVWSELIIDSYSVVCRYIEPNAKTRSSLLNAKFLDLDWLAVHVRQSQYLLQIVKCNDLSCCPQ